MTRMEIKYLINGQDKINKMVNNAKDIQYLIIGATGIVGKRLGMFLTNKKIPWVGTHNKRPKNRLLKLDITEPGEVDHFFSEFSPRVVFHCANLTGGVNFCQAHAKEAADFHLNATKKIGMQCKNINATMVFISTDYVFDGTKDSYKEEDLPNPLNIYGKLKLEAEQWISTNLEHCIIVRTTNIYGWDPETVTPNYMMSLHRTLKEKKRFKAPSFLYGNPTYVGDLVEAILELHKKGSRGIFHIVGSSFVNRFEWAKKACVVFGLDKSLINEIKEPEPNMVPRPIKSRLSAEKFTTSYSTILHNLNDGLNLMKSDIEI